MKQEEQENNGGKVDVAGSVWKKLPFIVKIKMALGAGGCLLIVFLGLIGFFAICNAVGAFLGIFTNDSGSSSENEPVSDEEIAEAEKEFKEKVESVADSIESKYSVSINKPLLVATVLYSKAPGGVMTGDNEEITDEDLENIDSEDISVDKYNVSKRELTKLAKQMVDGYSYSESKYRDYLVNTYIPKHMKDSIQDEDDPEDIADEIFELADFYKYLFYDEDENQTSSGCDPLSDLKVHVSGRTIPFKEYVISVVWPESSYWSANSESYSVEYGKAQTMASKTYAIKHKYKPGVSEITIDNTTEGFQVWCDIYTAGACGSTGNPSEKQIANLKQRYDDVADLFRVDDNGNLINTQYASNQATCDGSSAHTGCKEDASSNAMNQYNAYEKHAKGGKNFEEILDVYYQGHNGPFKGMPSTSSSCANGSGNWENWKQCDPKWGNISLGGSTVCGIGCLATSVSMLVANSGLKANVSGELNPGTFITALKSKGGFIDGGNFVWNSVSNVVPGFNYGGQITLCGMSKAQKAKKVKELLDKGYYVVMEVKGAYCGGSGQHWVAVTGVNGSTISMADPAGVDDSNTNLFGKYGNAASIIAYYKKS